MIRGCWFDIIFPNGNNCYWFVPHHFLIRDCLLFTIQISYFILLPTTRENNGEDHNIHKKKMEKKI